MSGRLRAFGLVNKFRVDTLFEMTTKPSLTTWQMLQRLSILLNAEYRRVANELGLQDVHVQILSFLQQANRYSNTLAAA